MVKDIAGKAVADGCVSETGKTQKQIILNRIAGHGAKPNPDWRPKWTQVPARHYFDKASCPPSSSDSAVSKVMMTVTKKTKAKAA